MNNLKVKMKEKMNNKGFSLVELIIVIAIMAVLIAVLAPQFLRYVERSRLQADNSAIGEIANAAKVAATDEDVAAEISATGATGLVLTIPTGAPAAITASATATDLLTELAATIGNTSLTSNTYTATPPTITLTMTGNVITATGQNYVEEVGGGVITPDPIF